jgi:hypothetical protein
MTATTHDTDTWRRVQQAAQASPMLTPQALAAEASLDVADIEAAATAGWVRIVNPHNGYRRYVVRDDWMQHAMHTYPAAHGGADDLDAMATYARELEAMRADPVGATEIATRCGVQRDTVAKWAARHEADWPAPRWTVGGRPAWEWRDVADWLRRTDRW